MTGAGIPAFVTYEGDGTAPVFNPARLNVGDEVFVYAPAHRRTNVYSAMVTGKARAWATFRQLAELNDYATTWRLRLDDQTDGNRQFSQLAVRFRTAEQHAYHQADIQAREFLRDQGLNVEIRSPWQARQIELARLLWPVRQ